MTKSKRFQRAKVFVKVFKAGRQVNPRSSRRGIEVRVFVPSVDRRKQTKSICETKRIWLPL